MGHGASRTHSGETVGVGRQSFLWGRGSEARPCIASQALSSAPSAALLSVGFLDLIFNHADSLVRACLPECSLHALDGLAFSSCYCEFIAFVFFQP